MVPVVSESLADSSNTTVLNNDLEKDEADEKKAKTQKPIDFFGILMLISVGLITVCTFPKWDTTSTVTLHHVFYYGWITAISTGFGVIPCYLFSNPSKFWIGVSNAVAGGMMIAASFSLAYEGTAAFTAAEGGILYIFALLFFFFLLPPLDTLLLLLFLLFVFRY